MHVVAEDVQKRHEEERGGSFEDLIRDGTGACLEASADASDSSLFTAVCYSPEIQLKPGQVHWSVSTATEDIIPTPRYMLYPQSRTLLLGTGS